MSDLLRQDDLASLDLKPEYRTGEGDLVEDFYIPCLRLSKKYDRAVGFFRSSVFLLAGEALVGFARRGGVVRLLCSPDLTEDDADALVRGYADRSAILTRSIREEINRMLAHLEFENPTKTLAQLISVGSIDVRLAYRPSGRGIFHEKLGIFRGAQEAANTVTFRGSANETWNAWSPEGNHESFEVFRSWITSDEDRVVRHLGYFEKLWRGQVAGVLTAELPGDVHAFLKQVARSTTQERDVPAIATPASPRRRTLMDHQKQALDAWTRAGYRGILEHATGSGKTLTAIEAIRSHIQSDPALVLVPSELLLQQWTREIETEVPDAVVLQISSKHHLWRKPNRLETLTSSRTTAPHRVTIATLQTASSPEFLERVGLSAPRLLVVCDEVHRSGSSSLSQVFAIDGGRRLGLSATPRRYGDVAGTQKILDYFGPILQPPFTLADAIRCGRLVQYTYRPTAVELTGDEVDRWGEITALISREVAMMRWQPGDPMSDRLRLLFIRRSRIAKQAALKAPAAVEIITREYAAGQAWLVYCDDRAQLRATRDLLTARKIPTAEYHTAMLGDAGRDLEWFRRTGGVMVSIRCLDEGIDIPEVSHALIMASSQNPREFIQRRGRVLRASPERSKTAAHIFDLLVMPPLLNEDVLSGASALARAEIVRASEFARHAVNKGAETLLLRMALDAGLDLQSVMDLGLELDDDDEIEG